MLHNTRILVVEDDASIRRLLVASLTTNRATVRTTGLPSKVKALLDEQTVDVVVLDWNLPGTNGAELAQQIRQHPNHCDTPVIFLSANHPDDVAEEIRQFPNASYVRKPFDPMDLLDKVLAATSKNDRNDRREITEEGSRR